MQNIAFSYIKKINSILENVHPVDKGLFKGKCHLLLYYYELYCATDDSSFLQKLSILQEEVTEEAFAAQPFGGKVELETGLAGFACIALWLKQQNITTIISDKHFSLINAGLAETCINMLKNGFKGYSKGAYGILCYFLLKEQTPAIQPLTAAILESITTRYLCDGIDSFFDQPAGISSYPVTIDLGIHYGLCGFLLLLIQAHEAGYSKANAVIFKIIREGVYLILKHKLDIDYSEEEYSFFPDRISREDFSISTPAKLCWQNSDLNQLLILYKMYTIAGDVYYRDIADYMGLQTVSRKQYAETKIDNSSIVDGAAGVAKFYSQLGNYTHTQAYAKASEYWTEQTLLYLDKELASDRYAGNEIGLLDGLTGVSLVLLNFWRPKPAKWSRLILL